MSHLQEDMFFNFLLWPTECVYIVEYIWLGQFEFSFLARGGTQLSLSLLEPERRPEVEYTEEGIAPGPFTRVPK